MISSVQVTFILRRITINLIILAYGIFSPLAIGQGINFTSSVKNDKRISIESNRQSTDSAGDIFSAYGNVKVTYPQEGIIARSQQAQYLKLEEIVVFTGDVDLSREGLSFLQGQRAIYFLEHDQLVVDSDFESQVLLKLFFESNKESDQSS